MIYLSSFELSDCQISNPNIYPHSVFREKYIEPFVFTPITVFYGNNGSEKSTLLNIIANKLELKGRGNATSNSYGITNYCATFSLECSYSLGKDEFGFDGVFGRGAVMELLELKSSGASKLLSNLVQTDIIEAVSGYGKGKYKFKRGNG